VRPKPVGLVSATVGTTRGLAPRVMRLMGVRELTQAAGILGGEIDPTFIVTHRIPLSEAVHGYDVFKNEKEDCLKVVLKP